jgi:hypothetical protein
VEPRAVRVHEPVRPRSFSEHARIVDQATHGLASLIGPAYG